MVRALLERTFHPERLDAWFEQTADAQYTRELLFSTLFELMSQVVCGVRRSVHDAYQAAEHVATSVGAAYRKLARIKPTTATELVRYSARESRAVMEALESPRPSPIPGRVVKILDGNALAATQHRLKALRPLRAGALPGKAVAGTFQFYTLALWWCNQQHPELTDRNQPHDQRRIPCSRRKPLR